jgi:hypothetical protein
MKLRIARKILKRGAERIDALSASMLAVGPGWMRMVCGRPRSRWDLAWVLVARWEKRTGRPAGWLKRILERFS